jgi:hypothetical protein
MFNFSAIFETHAVISIVKADEKFLQFFFPEEREVKSPLGSPKLLQ